MRHPLAAVLLLLLLAVSAFAVTHLGSTSGRVYTVDQVVSGLARHPSAWVGRTILVRGQALQATEWLPPSRVRPTASMGAGGMPIAPLVWVGPSSWVGASLVTSPTLYCIAENEPCQPPLVEPLRPGSSVYVTLFDRMPDMSPPTTHATRQQPTLTLLVQGASPTLDVLRHLPLVARFAPRVRQVDWGHQAVYSVTILHRPAGRCMAAVCDSGVMVDTVAQ